MSSVVSTATTSAPSAGSTCGSAVFSEFPTKDAACAVGGTSGVPSNTTDVLSKCCKKAPVEQWNGSCGYFCLSFEQSVRELQTCFMDGGVDPRLIFCNSNNSATATGTPTGSGVAGASRTSGSGPGATGSGASDKDHKGAAPAVGVSKAGLGMLGMVVVSALAGALL
ncbi:hypothetical protein ACJQWK_05353 [Exserohilum turcicum]|uniref:Uncharacterized protein n=1 Tax=Exserohilum turcicum (strain 28A) TaxID=671987 RepID=R0I9F6_EXST2|nr:uncharacterized protein SETTUDRAFT_165522 [Exserohilum turcica Et28A]EOA82006.1 hypothetical protein SETTUDRAFT_165522 [Exserohilum turcica Et28A]